MRKLISTLREEKKEAEKKAQVGNEWSNILPKSAQARTTPPPPLVLAAAPLGLL